jgi:ADP-ribose pyrophosphatase YjhB (NUDIX family)
METIPERFYRVSAKALILNETRDKFLICKEDTGKWELPGGGLEWGETPQACITREIQEEMGLLVTHVTSQPAYFITGQSANKKIWVVNVLYETTVADLNYTPSEECVEIAFVNQNDIRDLNVFTTITDLAAQFDPVRHRSGVY